MSDDLVVIRTFASSALAELALSRLLAEGVQGMLLTQAALPTPGSTGAELSIGLAVHSRDANRAEQVLAPPPATGSI